MKKMVVSLGRSLSQSRRRACATRAPALLLTAIAFGLGLLPVVSPLEAREVPGALAGSFSVSPNGAAVYSLALEMPPGIGGMQPGLGLSYSSQAGNGLLGVGWQLTGLSGIARCQPTHAVDGFVAPIEYGATDRFCLDGQRLINVSGTYGADGSVYRTELETWRKVVAHSSEECGGGPCSFTVTLKNGATWTYGGGTGSIRAAGKDEVRVWALTEARDLHGNFLQVSYTQSPLSGISAADGQYYPQSIRYTGNGDFAPRFSVVFGYEERPDPLYAWQGGAPIRTLARLASVETRLDGTAIKRWSFAYTQGVASGRSRLHQVTECRVTESEEVCLPATALAFTDNPAPGFRAGETTATGASPSALGYFPMDVNGDGLGDLVQAWGSAGKLQLTAYLSKRSGFDTGVLTETGSGTSALELLPMDIDGNGRTDLVQLWSSSGKLQATPYLAQADGTFEAGTTESSQQGSSALAFYPMDVNADGRTDLVQAVASDGELSLVTYLSEGNGFSDGMVTETGSGISALSFIPLDANGDGRIDLLQLWSKGGVLQATAHLSDGVGFSRAVGTDTGAGTSHLGFFPLDVNGDGLTDLVQVWEGGGTLRLTTYPALGDGTYGAGVDFDTGASPTSIGFWPMDMIGDPSTDLVQGFAGADGSLRFQAYRPFGDRFLPVVLGAAGESTAHLGFWPMDVNGDGKADLVRGFEDENGALALEPLFSDGAFPDLVETITDGLGGRVRVDYAATSDPAVYSPDLEEPVYPESPGVQTDMSLTPAVYPVETVGGGRLHVVAGYTKENAPKLSPVPYSYAYSYRYGGARMDLSGRGWLGFERVELTAETGGQKTLRTYLQSFPETGLQQSAEVFCGASKDPRCTSSPDLLLSASSTRYQQRITATGADSLVVQNVYEVLTGTVFTDVVSYGQPGVRLREDYLYNELGDLVRKVDYGQTDGEGANEDSGDDVYTCLGYATDDPSGPWMYGYVSDVKVSSTADLCDDFRSEAFRRGIDYSLSHVVYDVASGTMDVLEQKAWDDGNNVYLATETYDYDRFGNPGRSRDPAGAVTTTVWESGFHTYPDRVEAPTGEGGPVLSQSFGFDPRFGVQVAGQDPNGHVATVCLDELGRTVATQGPVPEELQPPPTDPNCVPAAVTGTAPLGRAQVITLTEGSFLQDGQGLSQVSRVLQDWPTAETPRDSRSWRDSRAFLDGLGRTYKTLAEAEPATASAAKASASGKGKAAADPGDIVRCAVFSGQGKILQKSLPFFGTAASDCSAGSTQVPFWLHATYDAYGRPTRVTYPATTATSGTLTVAYPDATTTEVTLGAGGSNPAVKRLQYRYVAGNKQVWKMVLPGEGNATTTFEMDPVGRILAVTDPATPDNPQGVTTRNTFDSLGRPLTTDNPDQNTTGDPAIVATRYVYGTDGRLASTTDAAGQTTLYAYDLLGRLETITYAGGSVIENTYDQGPDGRGRLTGTALSEPSTEGAIETSSYAFTYDAYGNRLASELTLAGEAQPYVTEATYDPLARVRTFHYADGSELTRDFAEGWLRGVSLDGAPVVSYYDFTAQGKPREVIYGNNVITTYEYSPLGQMTAQTVTRPGGSGRETLLDQELVWNEVMELVELVDRLSADGSWTYSYANRRLVRADQGGTQPRTLAYDYDASGNLVRNQEVAFEYAAHRITRGTVGEDPVLEVNYHPDGATAERKFLDGGPLIWNYGYDARGDLSSVEKDGVRVLELTYDALGRRLSKTTWGSDGKPQVVQLSPGPGLEIRRYADGSEESRKYVRGISGTAAVVTSAGGADEILYLTHNHLGSVSLGTDAAAVPQVAMAFLPWGLPDQRVSQRPPGFDRPLFQGRELDETSGLYDFGARYYQPRLGRFLTPDNQLGARPLTPDAWNRFAFALNSPVVYVDPTGHSVWQSVVGGLIGGVEIAAGVAIDVVSGGTLEAVGGALIGAGVNGLTYSVTHSGNFSWEQYGVQEGVGAAIGLVTAGLGEIFSAGGEIAAEVGEDLAEDLAEDVFGDAMEDAGGASEDVLAEADTEAGAAANEDVLSSADEGGGEGASCSASFVEGTLVATPQGLRAVQDLRPGDFVFGLDEATGTTGSFEVTETLDRSIPLTLTLTLGEETLTTTPKHPFFVEGEGWMLAADLEPGMAVTLRSGATAEVASSAYSGGTVRVFNLEVDGAHNYFVGNIEALVHNPRCSRSQAQTAEQEQIFGELQGRADQEAAGRENYTGKVSVARNRQTGEFRVGVNANNRAKNEFIHNDSSSAKYIEKRAKGGGGNDPLACAEAQLCDRVAKTNLRENLGVVGRDWDSATFQYVDGRRVNLAAPCANCKAWVGSFFSSVFVP